MEIEEGEIRNRLDSAYEHLQELCTERLFEDLKEDSSMCGDWTWSGDYVGRWLSSMSKYVKLGYPIGKIQEVVDRCISFQKPNGAYGYGFECATLQRLFGEGRLMLGMINTYAVLGWERCLDSAMRNAEFLQSFFPLSDNEFASSVAQSFLALYDAEKSERWLIAAANIIKSSKIWRCERKGHYHTLLNSVRSCLGIFKRTGEQGFFDKAKWWIDKGLCDVWVNGNVPEEVPDNGLDETCATVDWIMLNYEMWLITGEKRHLEYARFSFFNGLLGNQLPNGGFVAYRDVIHGLPGMEAHYCCSHSGSEMLADATYFTLKAREDKTGPPFPLDCADDEEPQWRKAYAQTRSYLVSSSNCFVVHEFDNPKLTEWLRSQNPIRFEGVEWGKGALPKWRDMHQTVFLNTDENGRITSVDVGSLLSFRVNSSITGILKIEVENPLKNISTDLGTAVGNQASPFSFSVVVRADEKIVIERGIKPGEKVILETNIKIDEFLTIEFLPDMSTRNLFSLSFGTLSLTTSDNKEIKLLADSPFRKQVNIIVDTKKAIDKKDNYWKYPATVTYKGRILETELVFVPYRRFWEEKRLPKRHGDYAFYFKTNV